MRNLSINSKLTLGTLILVLITIILGLGGAVANYKMEQDHHAILMRVKEIENFTKIKAAHLEWTNNLHNFLLSGQPFTGELDYTKCDMGKWTSSHVRAQEFKNLPEESQKLILSMAETHKDLHLATQLLLDAASQGNIKEANSIYITRILNDINEIRGIYTEIEITLSRQADDMIINQNNISKKTKIIIYAGMLIAIILGIIIFILLNRTITRPIVKLNRRIHKLTAENGSYETINDIQSNDELGELVKAFNQLINKINAHEFNLQAQNQELMMQSEELAVQNEEIQAQQEEIEENLAKLIEREDVLLRLYKFSRLLTETINLDQMLDRVLKGIMEEVDAQVGLIYLRDRETNELQLKTSLGIRKDDLLQDIKLGEGLAGRACLEGKSLFFNYGEGQLKTKGIYGEISMRTECYLPLIHHNELLGVIGLGSIVSQGINEERKKLIISMADQVAVALDNALTHVQTEAALIKIQEVDRVKSELLNTVSHELRTPLASIFGFAELLLKRTQIEGKEKKYLSTIYHEAVRLTGLINNFLDLQRIESGRMEFATMPVNLKQIIQNNVEIYKGQSTKHDFITEIADDLPEVLADSDRVTQVLGNLLSNAVKYSPEGGPIEIRAYRSSKYMVTVSVRDYGLGIPSDAQDKMFQPFFRVDNSDRRQIGGTGLGLAICQKIISSLGGEIKVYSQHGQGSTFTFTLPIAHQSVTEFKVSSAIPEDKTESRYILIVEDDPAMAELVADTLNGADIKTKAVTSGREMFSIIKNNLPMAIILDIILEGEMDGWDVLGHLKADPETRDIPIIITSCLDKKGKGKKMGASEFLVKPFSPEKLLYCVNAVMKQASGVVGIKCSDSITDLEKSLKSFLLSKGLTIREVQKDQEILVLFIDLQKSNSGGGVETCLTKL